jgi:hypothetical protein
MLSLKWLPVILAFSVMPAAVTAQQLSPSDLTEALNRMEDNEQEEMQLLPQYSPLVETYVQYIRRDKQFGTMPDGDRYFLGRAVLAKGLELEPLNRETGVKQKMFGGFGDFFSMEFVAAGFLQMVYLDRNGFDRHHYKFEYVQRVFLGEVRCMVFDVKPLPKAGKRRFRGQIWVEDRGYHIVRFRGSYGEASWTTNYFNFESSRMNVAPNLWVPAYIYVEHGSVLDAKARNLGFKPFRAQVLFWGYHVARVAAQQERSKVVVQGSVADPTKTVGDLSVVEAERSWGREAEDNVVNHLEEQGLLAPYGKVDKMLETVVKNLEITNDLDENIHPDVRCRVLMTTTLESFTIGHTIVLSRGLIDVLPDEDSLAAILSHELGHIVLGHRMNTQFAFKNLLWFPEKETFRHFDFTRPPEEEQSATDKGTLLLRNSPYNGKSAMAPLFLQTLRDWSKEIPNLISPHLGNRVPTDLALTPATSSAQANNTTANNVFPALQLGAHIRLDPWNDELRMPEYKTAFPIAEDEKRPFQITPLSPYLRWQESSSLTESPTGGPAESGHAAP